MSCRGTSSAEAPVCETAHCPAGQGAEWLKGLMSENRQLGELKGRAVLVRTEALALEVPSPEWLGLGPWLKAGGNQLIMAISYARIAVIKQRNDVTSCFTTASLTDRNSIPNYITTQGLSVNC